MNGPQRVVLGAWLVMIGLTAARALGRGTGAPPPSVFIGSGVLFTVYMVSASFLGPLPAALAVGTDVAALLLPYIRGAATGPLDSIAQGLDKLSGGYGAAPASSSASSSSSNPGGATPGTLVAP